MDSLNEISLLSSWVRTLSSKGSEFKAIRSIMKAALEEAICIHHMQLVSNTSKGLGISDINCLIVLLLCSIFQSVFDTPHVYKNAWMTNKIDTVLINIGKESRV